MHLLYNIALFFHLMGFASLFGVCAVQVRQPIRIARNGMMHGALTQLVSGVILVVLNGTYLSRSAIDFKLFILLVILGILIHYRRKEGRIIPAKPFFVIFGLTFLEVVIAVFYLR